MTLAGGFGQNTCSTPYNLLSSYRGSTSFASPTILPACEARVEKLHWLRVESPPNTLVTLSTCSSCFDTQLIVVSAPSGVCSDYVCVTANDDASGKSCNAISSCGAVDGWSSVTFCTEELKDYYALIYGFEGQSGEYVVTLTESSEPCTVPSNNEKAFAALLTLPQSIRFDTSFATGGSSACSGVGEGEHSLWYRVTGTGRVLEANTCNPSTLIANGIAVFSQ